MNPAATIGIFSLVVAVSGSAFATDDSASIFVQANNAYEAGNYPKAAELYESLVSENASGVRSMRCRTSIGRYFSCTT